jgi:hypothetical protein
MEADGAGAVIRKNDFLAAASAEKSMCPCSAFYSIFTL